MPLKVNIPVSTYRLQFNAQFTFKHALQLVEYLHSLGISHCYSSPLLKAKSGSLHGYDIVDHSQLNPEIGTEEEFESFVAELHKYNMGLIFDIIPNHMYLTDPANHWWEDVLENGPASPYSDYFDIDWHPPRNGLANKVLLPLLDQQYGSAIENQTLNVIYQEGSFKVKLITTILPTDPNSWLLILEALEIDAEKTLASDDSHLLELRSIITSLSHLPPATETDKEKIVERLREKEVIKRRLNTVLEESDVIAQMLQQQLTLLNGQKENPHSFDNLEAFLNAQNYRLAFGE